MQFMSKQNSFALLGNDVLRNILSQLQLHRYHRNTKNMLKTTAASIISQTLQHCVTDMKPCMQYFTLKHQQRI